MRPVRGLDEIAKEVLKDKADEEVVTFGILVADKGQAEAYQYILKYLSDFDEASGEYIDFFIPGYFIDISDYQKNYCVESSKNNLFPSRYAAWEFMNQSPIFISRNQTEYYFSDELFKEFRKKMKEEWGISYTYNPMLILVEVNMEHCRGELKYQNKLVIELDDNDSHSVRRSGELFEAIFDIAKRASELNGIKREMRKYYIKGKAVNYIYNILAGNHVDVIGDISGDIIKTRIKRGI